MPIPTLYSTPAFYLAITRERERSSLASLLKVGSYVDWCQSAIF